MPTLTVSAPTDYRVAPNDALVTGQNIALIDFTAANAFALFLSSQFGGTNISDFVTIDGSSGNNEISITMSSGDTDISAADWSFTNWDTTNDVRFNGSIDADTITGSIVKDNFVVIGSDVIDGGDGDDIFNVDGNHTFSGAQLNGGAGAFDRLSVDNTADLRGVTISNIEGLAGGDLGVKAILDATQVGAGKINIFSDESVGGTFDIEIMGSPIDLSTAQFATWGAANSITLMGTAGLDNIKGSSKADIIIGGASTDTLLGNGGDDIIRGGAGRDTMTGGTGLDDFDFNSVAEIGKSSTRDRIKDFAHNADDIDLSDIDANGSAAGNTAFKFLAAKGAAFTGVKGQLHWFQINAAGTANDKTIIEGDVNGDGKADFQIELTGLKTLSAGDFIL